MIIYVSNSKGKGNISIDEIVNRDTATVTWKVSWMLERTKEAKSFVFSEYSKAVKYVDDFEDIYFTDNP